MNQALFFQHMRKDYYFLYQEDKLMGLLSKHREDNGADEIIKILTTKTSNSLLCEEEWAAASDGANCYAWAANCEAPQSAKPNPGTFSGHDSGRTDIRKIIDGAQMDGMIYGVNSNVDNPPWTLKWILCCSTISLWK